MFLSHIRSNDLLRRTFMLLLKIFLERGRKLIAAGSPKKPAFWGALQVVPIVVK